MSRGSTAIMEPRVMGRPRKKPTRPIRVYEEVAVLIHKLAKIFDQDAPEFASDILLPILEKKQQEAASILLGKPKQK